MTNHPITPPDELVDKWVNQSPYINPEGYIATQAAQWGADQELDACCKDIIEIIAGVFAGRIIDDWDQFVELLRDGRRPKPPSLKEQALETLKYPKDFWSQAEVDTIRRALEALDD